MWATVYLLRRPTIHTEPVGQLVNDFSFGQQFRGIPLKFIETPEKIPSSGRFGVDPCLPEPGLQGNR